MSDCEPTHEPDELVLSCPAPRVDAVVDSHSAADLALLEQRLRELEAARSELKKDRESYEASMQQKFAEALQRYVNVTSRRPAFFSTECAEPLS
jgi:hypothetical protein